MFTLIKNYKTLLMMCVANSLEGPVANYDANEDNDISADELRALLESSPEAREASTLAEVETLEAALEIVPTQEVETAGRNSSIEQKTLQYIATKILRFRGETVHDGSIDGDIGTNSLRDIKNASGIDFEGSIIWMNTIHALVTQAQGAITEKRAEIQAATEAREARETAARDLLSEYSTIEEVRELERDQIRLVQDALNTLGYNVGSADGVAGNMTETGFNAYVEDRRVAGIEGAETDAKRRLGERRAAVEAQEENMATLRDRLETLRNVSWSVDEQIEAAEAAISAAQIALTEIEISLSQAETDKTAAEAERTRLQGILDGLQTELTQAETDKTAAETERTRLQGILDGLQTELTQAETDKTAAETERTRLQGVLDGLQTELTQAETDKTAAETERTRLQGVLDGLQTELTQAETARDEAQTELNHATARQAFLSNLSREINGYNIDVNTPIFYQGGVIMIDYTGWGGINYEMETAYDLHALGFASEQELITFVRWKLNKDGEVTVDLVSTAQTNFDAADGEVTRLTGEVSTAQTNFDAADAEVTRLTGEVTRLTGEVSTAQTNFDAADAEVTRLTGEVTRLIGEVSTAQTNFDAADAEVTRLTGEVTRLTGEVSTAQTNFDAADAEVTRLTGEITRITDMRVAAAETVGEINHNLTVLRAQDARFDARVADFEARLREADAELGVLNMQVGTADINLRRRTEDLEILNLERSIESDVYSRIDIEGEVTAESIREALLADPEGRELICQLQADLKLLTDQDGNPLYRAGIDGSFGPGTTRAVEAALAEYGSLIAIRREARMAEVRAEAERNTGEGRTHQGIDLVAMSADEYEAGALERFLAEYTVTTDMPDELRIQPDMNEVDREQMRERQRSWVIEQAIMMGDRENADGTRLTFIDGLSQFGNDSLRDVTADLRRNFETARGREELATAMFNGVDIRGEDFDNSRGVITLGQTRINANLLDSAYIATGSDLTRDIDGSSQRGTMEVPIWNPDGTLNERFAELDFANATYINGAIVMTMKNGCEGNLVIIPVQREKYVPPVVVQRPRPEPEPRNPEDPEHPEDPQDPENPEVGLRCRIQRVCRADGYIWQRQVCFAVWAGIFARAVSRTDWERTNERCGNDDDHDHDPNGGGDTSDPGHRGGGDEWGQGPGGTGGTWRD